MSHTDGATVVEELASADVAAQQPQPQQPTPTTTTNTTTNNNNSKNNPTLDQTSNTQYHTQNLTSQQLKTADTAGPSAAPYLQQHVAPSPTTSHGALAHEAAAACDPAITPNYLSCNTSPVFSQCVHSAAASSNSSPIFASFFNSPPGSSPPLQSPWAAWLANVEMSPLLGELLSSGPSPVQDLSKVPVVHATYASMNDAVAKLPTARATALPTFQGAALSQMTHLLQHQQVQQLLLRQQQRAEVAGKDLLSDSTSGAIQHAAPRVFVRRRRSKNARKGVAMGQEADGGARAGAPCDMCASSTSTEAQPPVPPAATAAAPASAEPVARWTGLSSGLTAAPLRRFDQAMDERARQIDKTRQMWGDRMTE